MGQKKGEELMSPVKSFFLGNISESAFSPFPALSKDEQETVSLVIESVQRFLTSEQEGFPKYDRSGSLPDEFLTQLKELGLFGIIIPTEHNGFGLSASSYARIIEELAWFDGSAALTIGAHTSIGMRGLLLFGNQDQKARYLPRLATGEMVAAFCLTEAGSGSDAASVKTNAVRQEDGSYILNGEKIWITNGGWADFFTVFAKTGEKEMTAFIVERAFAGVSNGPKEDKMGIRASSTTTVAFKDVRVPPENILGPVGQGFKVAMTILNNGRTGLGGGCVGSMKRCIKLAVEQANTRKQFGKRLVEFGLIQEKLTDMAVRCFAGESLVMLVSSYIDQKHPDFSTEAAISKVYLSEALWSVANDALQIAGGNGFMREYPYEQIVRDARINLIFEGTNEILRLYIGLSGLKDAGEHLKDVSKSVQGIFNDPIESLGLLSSYVGKKVSALTTLGLDSLAFPHECLKAEARIFEHYTHLFSEGVESALKTHGRKIIEQQFLVKRLADVSIDLFTGLAVIARVSELLKSGVCSVDSEPVLIARIFAQSAKRRMNANLRRLSKNEDPLVEQVSAKLVQSGKYSWDVAFGR